MTTYKISINQMKVDGKIPPGDPRWATFNDAFANHEIGILDLANAIYTGHAYSTWHEGRRKLDNFVCGQHLAVDLDTDDERSNINRLIEHDLVRSYAALLHTTPSHTTQTPRCRIIFLLDRPITDAGAYSAAARFLAGIFDGADMATTDASRFFYGAKDCQIELPWNVLPLAHLRRFYRLHKPAGGAVQPAISNERAQAGAPVEKPALDEIEKVQNALGHVDPWGIDYNKWIAIIAALKRELGEEALPIARAWADGKPGEVEREWARLKETRSNGAGLGTIFWLAKRHGFELGTQH